MIPSCTGFISVGGCTGAKSIVSVWAKRENDQYTLSDLPCVSIKLKDWRGWLEDQSISAVCWLSNSHNTCCLCHYVGELVNGGSGRHNIICYDMNVNNIDNTYIQLSEDLTFAGIFTTVMFVILFHSGHTAKISWKSGVETLGQTSTQSLEREDHYFLWVKSLSNMKQ